MQLACMNFVWAFIESNVALGDESHHLLLGLGLYGVDGHLAEGEFVAGGDTVGTSAGLSWEVYNEGGHDWRMVPRFASRVEELVSFVLA